MKLRKALETMIVLLHKIAAHTQPKKKKPRGRPKGSKNKKKGKNENKKT